jgi:hypothetical protein
MARLGHTGHERHAGDAVLAHADELRLALGRGAEQLEHGGVAEQRAHPAVEGARRAAALHVAEDRHAGVLAEALLEQPLDLVDRDRVAVAVARALGHHHDAVAAPALAAGVEHLADMAFPVVNLGGLLGDEDPVGAAGDGAHEGEVAAVAAHYLDHKGALVAGGGRADRVEGLGDPVEGRVGADGHVGAAEVVVDRADHADDAEEGVARGRGGVDRPLGHELGEQLGPLLAEQVGPGEAAVAADHHEPVDAVGQEVGRRRAAALAGAKLRAAGGADRRAALLEDAAHVLPAHASDQRPALNQALVALVDREHLAAAADPGAHHRAHRRVHPRRVPAAGQDADAQLFLRRHNFSPSDPVASRPSGEGL